MKKKNIFGNIPGKLSKELSNKILSKKDIKIVRIISKKHITPKGKWYNQSKNEFVLLLKGSAKLTFIKDNKTKTLKMKKGDYINIPSHLKHRVDKTDKETVWLTIFH